MGLNIEAKALPYLCGCNLLLPEWERHSREAQETVGDGDGQVHRQIAGPQTNGCGGSEPWAKRSGIRSTAKPHMPDRHEKWRSAH